MSTRVNSESENLVSALESALAPLLLKSKEILASAQSGRDSLLSHMDSEAQNRLVTFSYHARPVLSTAIAHWTNITVALDAMKRASRVATLAAFPSRALGRDDFGVNELGLDIIRVFYNATSLLDDLEKLAEGSTEAQEHLNHLNATMQGGVAKVAEFRLDFNKVFQDSTNGAVQDLQSSSLLLAAAAKLNSGIASLQESADRLTRDLESGAREIFSGIEAAALYASGAVDIVEDGVRVGTHEDVIELNQEVPAAGTISQDKAGVRVGTNEDVSELNPLFPAAGTISQDKDVGMPALPAYPAIPAIPAIPALPELPAIPVLNLPALPAFPGFAGQPAMNARPALPAQPPWFVWNVTAALAASNGNSALATAFTASEESMANASAAIAVLSRMAKYANINTTQAQATIAAAVAAAATNGATSQPATIIVPALPAIPALPAMPAFPETPATPAIPVFGLPAVPAERGWPAQAARAAMPAQPAINGPLQAIWPPYSPTISPPQTTQATAAPTSVQGGASRGHWSLTGALMLAALSFF